MDDKKLWEEFLSECKPLRSKVQYTIAIDANNNLTKLKNTIKAKKPTHSHDFTIPIPPLRTQNLAIGDLSTLNRAQAERMRKGRLTIEQKLDLHYCTLDQAEKKLKTFLYNCYQQRIRTVLVVTGKGKEGTGAIRTHIPIWLSHPETRPLILAATHATASEGGDGAYYILLRSP